MKESAIETYLVKRVEALGGETRKVKWIGRRGAPDRLVMFKRGRLLWVELKTTRGLLSPAQVREHIRLRLMGQKIFLVRSKSEVEDLLADA
jgi:hypothetical protein